MADLDRERKRRRDALFRQLLADNNISADARLYGAAIYLAGKATDGSWTVEFGHRDFAAISAGKTDDETVRRRLNQLRSAGYLSSRPNGTRNPKYEFAPTPAQGSTVTTLPVAVVGSSDTDPTTATGSDVPSPHIPAGEELDPTAGQGSNLGPHAQGSSQGFSVVVPVVYDDGQTDNRARGCREFALLTEWLGTDHSPVLDRLAEIDPNDWPTDVWAWYRPPGWTHESDGGGTQWYTFREIELTKVPAVLADGIRAFNRTKQSVKGINFRMYIDREADHARGRDSGDGRRGRSARSERDRRGDGSGGRREAAPTAPPRSRGEFSSGW